MTLSWDDPNDSSIIRYRYQQKAGDGAFGSWNDIDPANIDSTSEPGKLKYTVSNLTNGITYTFRVYAEDNHEDSDASAEVSASPAPPPPLPLVPLYVSNIGQPADTSVGVDADLSSDQAQQFWTGTNVTDYDLGSIDVHFQSAPGSGVLTVSVRETNADAKPGDTVHTLNNPGTMNNPGTIEPGFVRFTAPGNAQLTANEYYFVHLTFSGSGTPPRLRTTVSSNLDSGTATGWGMYDYRYYRDSSNNWPSSTNALKISINQVLDPPAAPANLEATVGDGHVVLSWDDPLDQYINKYQYSTDSGASYTDIALTDIDSSETGKFKYTVENLTNGTTYTFDVRAVNSAGNGGVSTETAVMMPAAPATSRQRRATRGSNFPGTTPATTP